MQGFKKQIPQFSHFFKFSQFNQVQLKCLQPILKDKRNVVVSAPTSSGKTVIFQLAIINQIKNTKLACLYLAPIKSLCHQKSTTWKQKFQNKIKIFELTSDTSQQEQNQNQLDQINLVIATPQKIDSYSRKSLSYLSRINLLLVDQVHMLNFEERGATLEAVVSRIMSINNPRVIAVSATIPNLKQVAQWLRVPKQMTFLFGQQCRPVKINKVVLGFKSSNNPYTFQKVLNYKLTQVIRSYSQQKGVLVFCQTQKGTQMACQQVISDMKQRQFIENDQILMALIQGSKRVSNTSLQIMIPQGVAFHNAGLSLQDRSIVQKLFLESKIRILCTTSTLAMGINLPARLVVIKSTQCYRGSGKGYQQYTQIEMDQMMGRAGRPPFDTEGTVVIMTQKHNYNKYLNSGKLQTLQSHLYNQLTEHINAQICLKSIKSFDQAKKYFMNSFCYVRMKNSPNSYGIKGSVQSHVQKVCLQSIAKLNNYSLIKYYPQNKNITPRQLGINVARNSIQIDTIVNIVKQISKVKTQRDFLMLLCDSQEIKRYRNKLDQRKLLKQINEKNKYLLKNAISNPQKKCYVILQCQLDGRHIQSWQIRKQAKQMIYFMRRLTYCVKTACQDLKLFWPYFWSCQLNKFFTVKFWDRNEQMTIKQFPQLNEKWKAISAKGFKNIGHLMNNLQYLDTICQKGKQFSQTIAKKVNNLKSSVSIKLQSCFNGTQNKPMIDTNPQYYSSQMEENTIEQKKFSNNSKDILINIKFRGSFDENFKYIFIIVGQGYDLYCIRTLKQQCKQTTIAIASSKRYNVALIKNNFVGFDQFYQIVQGKDIRIIQDVAAYIDNQSDDKMNKVHKQNKNHNKNKNQSTKSEQRRSSLTSLENLNSQSSLSKQSILSKKPIKKSVKKKRSKSNQWIVVKKSEEFSNDTSPNINVNRKTMRPVNKIKNQVNLKSRKKRPQDIESSDDDFSKLAAKTGTYIPLNQYKCWKSGFRPFQDPQSQQQNEKTANKRLNIVDQGSSKQKNSQVQVPTVKSKQGGILWDKYTFNYKKPTFIEQQKNLQSNIRKQNENQINLNKPNPYDYFLNLFDK